MLNCGEAIPSGDEYEILLHALRITVTGLRLPNHIHGIIIFRIMVGTFN